MALFVLAALPSRAQLSLDANGHVGIGTTPTVMNLTVQDTLYVSGTTPTINLRNTADNSLSASLAGSAWVTRLRGSDGVVLTTSMGDVVSINGTATTFAGGITAASSTMSGLAKSGTVSTGEMSASSLYMTTDPGNPSGHYYYLWWDPDTHKINRAGSSRRYKEDIRPLEADYRALLRVQPRSFRYKGGAPTVGYIAEELHELGMREVVVYDREKRPDAIHYHLLILHAAEILKDHDRDLESLKSDNTALRGELAALRADVEALRRAVAASGRE